MRDAVAFRSRRVVTPHGAQPLCVVVRDGVITDLTPFDQPPSGIRVIDIEDVLMPGLVDSHVHLNDPGRSDWEGFASGTRAAAAGGVTTVVDMPLNSIPATTTVASLERKREAARGQCFVDVGFWGGVVPSNAMDVRPLWDAGVLGFKCFLAPSGVPEFENVNEEDLRRVAPTLAELGAPLLVHAELPSFLLPASAGGDPRKYSTYLATRPDAAEVEAVRLLISLSRETGARVHFVHIATAEALPLLRAARSEGLHVTSETCPHYLHFAAESIEVGHTEVKCAPPIRSASNAEKLWTGLVDGDLDLIVSDHSPAPPSLKDAGGSFMDAWGGIASLQLGLPVVWTGAQKRGITLERIAEWMSAAPARLAGLPHKGAIEVGRDADIVVFDPGGTQVVNGRSLYHRHPLTPYDAERLTGVVRATYLRGELAWSETGGHTDAAGILIERAERGDTWNLHN